ncbi:BamA/TamA family outer membrane protein [Tenacibaculum sp. UWU-22]|uniref:translocation and assembly module lipoprotein TamL n=1 Tax=Tenacibaculum sp. UWU-22 TaxID=3234187 RepID=UPI0034DB17F3
MKKLFFYLLFLIVLGSCNSIKRVADGEQLLAKNIVYVDGKKDADPSAYDYIIQRSNAKALGVPLSLYFYNLGNPNSSKTPTEWGTRHKNTYNFFKSIFSEKQSIGVARSFINLNNWFLNSGEAPVIIDNKKIKRTVDNLKTYYQTQGYFKTKVTSKRDSISAKKGIVSYYITKGNPVFLDTITKKIASPILDSIYNTSTENTFLKSGDQYQDHNFENEADRLTKLFRNNGVYHFNLNSIGFYNIDTANVNNKTNVSLEISDRIVEKKGDYFTKPYKIQTIKKVNVFTDYSYSSRKEITKRDSTTYQGVNYIAFDKLRYNPKYLSQSIFLQPNQVYSDSLRNLTRMHLRGLKNFKTTTIKFNELNDNELETNIFLVPLEKHSLGFSSELSRSNIRNFDISTKFSILNRNMFKGAEIFNISFLGSYFNSNNGPGWEIGSDLSLEVPRFMAPFGINKYVPKRMFPRTKFYTGISIQKNIGLDKQNYNLGIDYKWQYNRHKTIQLEILNTQYVRNLNVSNYFNVYASEYTKLEKVVAAYDPSITLPAPNSPENASEIVKTMQEISSSSSFAASNPVEYQNNLNINNRYNIISSDFLIPVIAYTFTYNNQNNFNNQNFSYFRIRISNSGNIIGALSKRTNSRGQKTAFKIPIAQYFKTDIEYKKFWETSKISVLGFRTFLGTIFPYNNSDIPFSKSYFAGGSNDIRAWRTYDLGPGTQSPGLEYNIGNLKFLTSLEYRFDLIGSFKSALFVDAGNIWNMTKSSYVDSPSKFKGLSSLKDMAIGSGFGLRYDFKLLVARLDIGFKVYEPYLKDDGWLKDFNFGNAVYNIGINYPF